MPTSFFSQPRPSPRGFTLVETIISLGVASLILLAALSAVGVTSRMRIVASGTDEGLTLAEDLMSEVLQYHYEEPDDTPAFGRESGEDVQDRTNWDDIDDYDGMRAAPPRTKDDRQLDEHAGWERTVSVVKADPVTLAPLGNQAGADTGVRLVTVTVRSPGGVVTTLTALRGDSRALERSPTFDHSYVSNVTIELQVGPDVARRLRTGVAVLNHRPPDEETPDVP